MKFAGREVSIYEIINGHGRWYWDRRYSTEAEQLALMPPLSEELLAAIDEGLANRVQFRQRRHDVPSRDDLSIQSK